MNGDRGPDESDHRGFANAAWSIPGYLLGGMLVYGGIGWLLDRWLRLSVFLPVGVLLGLGLAIYLIYVRYGR